nr:hypothetical protein [Methanospirillum hungatei]
MSPVTTTARISRAVDAIMACASEIPVFLMDPADRAIEIVTGIIVRLDVRIGCKRFSDSSSPNLLK